MIELRDRALAERWLCAGLCLMRMAEPTADECALAAPWIAGVLSESGALPPIGVVADVGHLITGRTLRGAVPLPAVDARLRGAVRAYEDNVLGRLEADPWLEAIADVAVRMPEAMRARAVALLTGHLAQRLGYGDAIAMSPGIVRAMLRLPKDELARAGHAALTEGGEVFDALVRGYAGLTEGARRAASLLTEGDVFLMENLAVLGELTQRMAIEQMIEAADALGRELPRRLKPKARREPGRIPTAMTADASYPTGGFAAIATSGAIENLVISELIYMEDARPGRARREGRARESGAGAGTAEPGEPAAPGQPGAPRGVDLFDLRYAEGELLYYTRDESVFVRGRRVIAFALLPDLAAARYKDPAMPWQRLVAAIGLVACSVRRLAAWLDAEGLLFRVAFVSGDGGSDPLAAERGLCALILRELVERGIAEVTRAPSLDAVIARAGADAQRSDSDLVIVGMQPRLPEPPPPGVTAGALSLARARPALTWAHRPPPQTESGAVRAADTAWRAWTQALLDMLQEIL